MFKQQMLELERIFRISWFNPFMFQIRTPFLPRQGSWLTILVLTQ